MKLPEFKRFEYRPRVYNPGRVGDKKINFQSNASRKPISLMIWIGLVVILVFLVYVYFR